MGASFLNLVTTKVTVKGEEQKFVSLRLLWGIQRSGFFNGRGKWAKGFENQRV